MEFLAYRALQGRGFALSFLSLSQSSGAVLSLLAVVSLPASRFRV